jgi:hypothetical protein
MNLSDNTSLSYVRSRKRVMNTTTEKNEYSASNAISVSLMVNIHAIHAIHSVLCIVLFSSPTEYFTFVLLFIPKWYITWLFSFNRHSWWCILEQDTKAWILHLFQFEIKNHDLYSSYLSFFHLFISYCSLPSKLNHDYIMKNYQKQFLTPV